MHPLFIYEIARQRVAQTRHDAPARAVRSRRWLRRRVH
jgi:hypothetical protein